MAKKNRKASRPTASPAGRSVLPAAGTLGAVFSGRGFWRWLWLAILIWLVIAVLYPGAVFQGQIFLSSDSSNSDAFTIAGDAMLEADGYPLWNPYLFAGMPSFGSLAYVKYLYPPSVIFNFLQQDLGFAPLTWMVGHLLFGGLGMAWLLSRWRLPVAALLLGAVVWLLFPKVVAWGVHGHGSKLGAAMYLPWLVGWALRVFDGAGLRAVGMVGLILGLQLLRGHPQITYYSLATVAWLGFWNTVMPLDSGLRAVAAAIRWRRLGFLVGGLALGFLIGGILLVPAQQYANISIRGQDVDGGGGVGLDYATGWSLAPAELGTFVLPAAAGFGKATYLGFMPFNDYPNYFGVLLLVLAAAAWGPGQRRQAIAMSGLALLAVMVAFGNLGFGLYEFLYGFLPFFNKFRIPSMALVVVAFCLAILAPRGLNRLRKAENSARVSNLAAGACGLCGAVFLLGGAGGLFEGVYTSQLAALASSAGRQVPSVLLDQAWLLHRADLIRIGLILLVAGSALWYSRRNEGFRRRGLLWALVILVAIDLLGVDRRITHPENSLLAVGRDAAGQAQLVPASKLDRKPPPVSTAVGGPQGDLLRSLVGHERVWPLGQAAQGNPWMVDGVRSLGGYHPAKVARYEKIRSRLYSEQPAGRLASWLAGSIVSVDQRLGQDTLQFFARHGLSLDPAPLNEQPPFFYRNLGALPRAYLVTRWQPVTALPEKDDLEPFLDAVAAGTLDLDGLAILDRTPDPDPAAGPGLAAEDLPRPEFLVDGANEVILQVQTPVPALLLLSDMMAPGWGVEVDGQVRDLLTADLVLRAVALDAGDHRVRFYFQDSSVRVGLILTLVGLVLTLAFLVAPMLRRSGRHRTGESPVNE